jgi:GTPase SAR1 family protein
MKKQITICGDTWVGKSSLLEALAKIKNNSSVIREKYMNENAGGIIGSASAALAKLFIKQGDSEISLLTTCGAIFNEEAVINAILSKADAVMYVFQLR